MIQVEEVLSSQDPGRIIANMRLFQEVLGDIARVRIVPKSLSDPKNPGTSYAGEKIDKGGKGFLLDFDWNLPPSHELAKAPNPPEKTDHPDLLDPLSDLRASGEKLRNLQRVRNFSKESVLENLREKSRREIVFSLGENHTLLLTLKDSITGHILWQAPLKEARKILLRGMPLKGLNYSSQI